MAKRRKKSKRIRSLAETPAYDLNVVKRLIKAGDYQVTGSTLKTALQDFGWGNTEINQFFLSLKHSHFAKRVYAEKWDVDWLDVYRAEMYGCAVYTHFFINNQGQLVIINSFKQDTSGDT